MAVAKIDPKVIFASEAPAQDTPAVFTNKTVGWGESRKNGGRPTIKQSNALQQETDLKILWLNENSVTPFDATIDYPENAVTLKDDVFKILKLGVWEVFLDKSSVGLINVDNTSDLNKPVSTATQTALNLKADKSATYTKVEVDNAIDLLRPPYLSSDVVDGNQTQDQINLYGGKKYDMPVGGYKENERVVLSNGDIVKSTIDGNVNDPNVDMTGWVNVDNEVTVDSVAEMLAIPNPFNGLRVFVKSHHAGLQKGNAEYIYDSSKSSVNNEVTVINGWVLCLDSSNINCFVAGFKADGSDESSLATKCVNLGLKVEIPLNVEIGIDVNSGLWTQWAYGLGTIKWLNYTASEDMERVVHSNVPVHPVDVSTYQQQQFADVRGALGGKNVGKRFECNPTKPNNYTFDSMQTLIDYGGADIVADMVAITDREVKQYSDVVYTATSAQHTDFKTSDIQVGDYIRAGSDVLGVVGSIDRTSGLITLIDGWGNTTTKALNVTPTSGAICYTPIAYRMWGRNDYVTARANNSEIYNIIGYELDVIAGHDLQDACGFFPVAFGTDTCVAAFRTGRGTRNWWYGLQILDDSANAGVHVGKGVTYGIQHGAQNTANSITVYSSQTLYGMKVDSASGAALRSDNTGVAVDINNADTGVKFNSGGASSSVIRNYVDNFLIKSDVLGKGSFSMTALGKTNRNIKTYTNISANMTLTRDNTTSIAIISSSAVTSVQLSTSFEDGEILEFYSNQSQNVDVGGLVTLSPSKKYTKLLYAGSAWIVLI